MDQTTSRPTDSTGGEAAGAPRNYLLYDGQCPFCARYVSYTRARAAFGGLALLDAREHPDLVTRWRAEGLDLNDGMLLVVDGNRFYGEEAVHALALASTGSGLLNRMNASIFRSRAAARVLYPLMRCGRNLTLRALGRSQLS